MHGQKKRRKRAIGGTTDIDGLKLEWELISEPQWTTDGHKGLCVLVRQVQGSYRDLVMEYPYEKAFFPQRPKLTGAIVEADIREAIDSGWNPTSRGRTFLFMTRTKLALGQQPSGMSKWWVT
jgi:hypothetical protein